MADILSINYIPCKFSNSISNSVLKLHKFLKPQNLTCTINRGFMNKFRFRALKMENNNTVGKNKSDRTYGGVVFQHKLILLIIFFGLIQTEICSVWQKFYLCQTEYLQYHWRMWTPLYANGIKLYTLRLRQEYHSYLCLCVVKVPLFIRQNIVKTLFLTKILQLSLPFA